MQFLMSGSFIKEEQNMLLRQEMARISIVEFAWVEMFRFLALVLLFHSSVFGVEVLNPFCCRQIVTGRKGFPRVAEQTAAWGTKSWQKPGESCCGKVGRGKG